MNRLGLIVVCLSVAACGGKKPPVVQPPPRVEIVTVKEPVPISMKVPAELLTPIRPQVPEFVPTTDPKATVALTPDGIRAFLAMIEVFFGRDSAWRAAYDAHLRAWEALTKEP